MWYLETFKIRFNKLRRAICSPFLFMQISPQQKKITKKGRTVEFELLTPDLTTVFQRDGTETDYDAMIYIYCHNDNKKTNLGGQIYVDGTPYYIGFAKLGDWDKIEKCRPSMHDGDMLDNTIKTGDRCHCILGLSWKEAHALEAHLINTLNIPLSKWKSKEHIKGTLVNKRRERKHETFDKFYPIDQWR